MAIIIRFFMIKMLWWNMRRVGMLREMWDVDVYKKKGWEIICEIIWQYDNRVVKIKIKSNLLLLFKFGVLLKIYFTFF